MRRASFSVLSAVVGVCTGLLSTYPVMLSVVASLVFWAMVGLGLGFFADERKTVMYSGGAYGVALAISFLLSRFGGTAQQLPSYLLLVFGLSLVGMAAGIVTAWLGSR